MVFIGNLFKSLFSGLGEILWGVIKVIFPFFIPVIVLFVGYFLIVVGGASLKDKAQKRKKQIRAQENEKKYIQGLEEKYKRFSTQELRRIQNDLKKMKSKLAKYHNDSKYYANKARSLNSKEEGDAQYDAIISSIGADLAVESLQDEFYSKYGITVGEGRIDYEIHYIEKLLSDSEYAAIQK